MSPGSTSQQSKSPNGVPFRKDAIIGHNRRTQRISLRTIGDNIYDSQSITGGTNTQGLLAMNISVTNTGTKVGQWNTNVNGVRHCPLDAKCICHGVVLVSKSRYIYIHGHTWLCTTTGTPPEVVLTSCLAELPCELTTKCLAVGFPSLAPVMVRVKVSTIVLSKANSHSCTMQLRQMASWTPLIVVLI